MVPAEATLLATLTTPVKESIVIPAGGLLKV